MAQALVAEPFDDFSLREDDAAHAGALFTPLKATSMPLHANGAGGAANNLRELRAGNVSHGFYGCTRAMTARRHAFN